MKMYDAEGEHENLKERVKVVDIEGMNWEGSWKCSEMMWNFSSAKGRRR